MGSVLFLINRFFSPDATCLHTATNTRLRGNVFVHFLTHYVRSCRICSCKQHTFIKLHQVTNAQETVLIFSRMSFCTKGIPARSCRIQFLAKQRKTFSPIGEKLPVRADEGWWNTRIPGPHPPSKQATLSWTARVHGLIMDSATPPYGCAQNDSIAWGIQESNGDDGSVQSCSSAADSSHLTLPACATQSIQGRGGMFSYISEHILFGVAGFAHVSDIDP